jgi:Methyltransferase domain
MRGTNPIVHPLPLHDGGRSGPPTLEDWGRLIPDSMVEAVRRIPHIRAGQYAGIDARHALDFYTRRYVAQLAPFVDLTPGMVVADCGAGYGWLAMAFALTTPVRPIALEPDEQRLEAGRVTARLLGVEDRIEWRVGRLGSLPLKDQEADVTYCIEVLEHVYGDTSAVSDLARVSRDLLIVTTPNQWFPIVAHDTRLPFCHWLPVPWRRIYARLCGRGHCECDNRFWSPVSLDRELRGFRRVSRFLHYHALENYLATYPFWLPYGEDANRYQPRIGRAKRAWYTLAARLGTRSAWMLPSLAGVYRRLRVPA